MGWTVIVCIETTPELPHPPHPQTEGGQRRAPGCLARPDEVNGCVAECALARAHTLACTLARTCTHRTNISCVELRFVRHLVLCRPTNAVL